MHVVSIFAQITQPHVSWNSPFQHVVFRPTIDCLKMKLIIIILQLTVSGLPGTIGHHVLKHVGMVIRKDPEECEHRPGMVDLHVQLH